MGSATVSPVHPSQTAALLVDGNPTSRTMLIGQLRSYGSTSISQATRIANARREIERDPLDLQLASAASHHNRYAQQLRACENIMVQRIEQALRRASQGEPVLALAELYAIANESFNARAVETAYWVLQRYRAEVPNADSWQDREHTLRQAYGTARNRPAFGDPRLRPAGGVQLGPLDRALAPAHFDTASA